MTKAEIIEKIVEQEFGDAIEGLKAALPKKNDVILVAARWRGLEKDMTKGILSTDYAMRMRAQISHALMELTERIPDEAPEQEGGGGGGGNGKPRVFISYNHRDKVVANKIRDFLKEKGLEVTIDSEAMDAGEDIKSFIEKCIRESDATLSLVSINSLLSAWVGMETLNTLTGEAIAKKKFIAVSIKADPPKSWPEGEEIETDFFSRKFVRSASKVMDVNLAEIKEEIMDRLTNDQGIDDLQNELKRYKKLKDNLPEIVQNLKERLTISVDGDDFDDGMTKVVNTLLK